VARGTTGLDALLPDIHRGVKLAVRYEATVLVAVLNVGL
jgi:hypothetical protein